MVRYSIVRLLQGIITAWVIATVVFLMLNAIGNPVILLLDPQHTQEQYDQMVHLLGYDKPLGERYVLFIWGAVRGDFGDSVIHNAPAMSVVLSKLPTTMTLATAALALAIVVAIPLGILSGYRPGGLVDHISIAIASAGQAVPTFLIAIFLTLAFGVRLQWLPVAGPLADRPHAVLPVVTVAAWALAALLRFTRSGTIETMSRPFVLLARAKGLPEWRVVTAHVVRNAMLPVITYGGLQIGVMMSGAAITESVFAIPGLGKLAIDSVLQRDRNMVQAVVVLSAVSFILINWITDLIYVGVDPRVRLSRV
jgi:peptide/nickel transport system permease protein